MTRWHIVSGLLKTNSVRSSSEMSEDAEKQVQSYNGIEESKLPPFDDEITIYFVKFIPKITDLKKTIDINVISVF